ncbi:hypothetical protein BKA93DRAFT_777261 [Sparassis latifolia]
MKLVMDGALAMPPSDVHLPPSVKLPLRQKHKQTKRWPVVSSNQDARRRGRGRHHCQGRAMDVYGALRGLTHAYGLSRFSRDRRFLHPDIRRQKRRRGEQQEMTAQNVRHREEKCLRKERRRGDVGAMHCTVCLRSSALTRLSDWASIQSRLCAFLALFFMFYLLFIRTLGRFRVQHVFQHVVSQ